MRVQSHRSTRASLVLMLFLAPACVRTASPSGEPPADPPAIQYDVVRQHAEQFDVDMPSRPPGSQLEMAAASYILGHLSLAGYPSFLDRVPVADTVSSTNVVALPPSGNDPEYLVAIPYGIGDARDQTGRELGLWLELARALTAVDEDNDVAFVAMGAESVENRGTRRLAQYLLDAGLEPWVITIRTDDRAGAENLAVFGSCMGEARGTLYSTELSDTGCREIEMRRGAITLAGFQETVVFGDIELMGQELFEFLTNPRS